jgi:hypothetical protein
MHVYVCVNTRVYVCVYTRVVCILVCVCVCVCVLLGTCAACVDPSGDRATGIDPPGCVQFSGRDCGTVSHARLLVGHSCAVDHSPGAWSDPARGLLSFL